MNFLYINNFRDSGGTNIQIINLFSENHLIINIYFNVILIKLFLTIALITTEQLMIVENSFIIFCFLIE